MKRSRGSGAGADAARVGDSHHESGGPSRRGGNIPAKPLPVRRWQFRKRWTGDGDEVWAAVWERHPDQRFLAEDPLYSLPEPVVAAVAAAVPGFFTAEQKAFELDLARATGGGFSRRRAIVGPAADFFEGETTVGLDGTVSRAARAVAGVRGRLKAVPGAEALGRLGVSILVDAAYREKGRFLRKYGGDPRELDDLVTARQRHRPEAEHFGRRDDAYAGWLLLDPTFRGELAELRERCGDDFVHPAGPPHPRGDAEAAARAVRATGEPGAAYQAFCRRWCLERMATWDVPVPLGPRVSTGGGADDLRGAESGVVAVLPWAVLKGGLSDVQAVIERLRDAHSPPHLRGWLRPESGPDARDGETTYQRLYWLYRVYELVLFRRYFTACRGNLGALDRAVAGVMGLEEDRVKKLRLRLAGERGAGRRPRT